MSHPNLLEDHLLSSRPLMDGSPSVVRAFTDCFRAPHGTGITPKSFYFDSFTKFLVTALTVVTGFWGDLKRRDLMFYVVFVTQLFRFLCKLFGSRVQLNWVIHNRPNTWDSHREDSNYPYYTPSRTLVIWRFHVENLKSKPIIYRARYHPYGVAVGLPTRKIRLLLRQVSRAVSTKIWKKYMFL